MATFKVGQRVRYNATPVSGKGNSGAHLAGKEAVIVRRACDWDWVIKGDALRDGITRGSGLAPDEIQADSCQLDPLNDPRCDQFIADMARFAKLADKRPIGEKLGQRLREITDADLLRVTGGA